ncbi:DUF6371 domain-containing protein [Spirosoma koreense]
MQAGQEMTLSDVFIETMATVKLMVASLSILLNFMQPMITEPLQDSYMKPRFWDQPASLIKSEHLERSLNNYDKNNLFLFLKQHFGETTAFQLMSQYQIGTTLGWSGGSVFWQINARGEIRSGKIVLLDAATGKLNQEPAYRPVLAHQALKLSNYILKPCLFGEHQLSIRPRATVGIVDKEVSALIATAFYPECIWLAADDTNLIGLDYWQALAKRNAVLYPSLSKDGSTFKKWSRKANDFQKYLNCQARISRYLEDNASEDERAAGMDVSDFLLRPAHPTDVDLAKGDNGNQVQPNDILEVTSSGSIH